ncbi:MAG: lipid-A-disaccharide synthase-related protein [Crocosphaera sp.]
MKILVISNGHGEDVIAASLVEALTGLSNVSNIAALPLVGEGYAYQRLSIPIIGTVKTMPSGGFNQDIKQLWRDVKGGLLGLTYHQYQTIRQWGKSGGKILAVGDILPLLLACLSGTEFAFVGTAKSEYYLRDEQGWLASTSPLDRWLGAMYFPWERWLMSRPCCCGVFVRDSLTAKILQRWPIPVYDLGNPMMEHFQVKDEVDIPSTTETLRILLLPGSRIPEAQENWQLMLMAVQSVIEVFKGRSLLFLAAIAPSLNPIALREGLMGKGWRQQPLNLRNLPIEDAQGLQFTNKQASLVLTQQAYQDCLHSAHVGISMAGTATEQFVGLGKPVITFPGGGPQFTERFAQNQTYLLGCSVSLLEKPQQVGEYLKGLLNHPEKLDKIANNGKQRLGSPGAAQRIAHCLLNDCFSHRD